MKSLILFLLIGFSFTLWSQEGNVTAGGEYSGSGGTISNSTGQTDFITLTSTEVNIQFGLQQVFYEESGVPTEDRVKNIIIGNGTCECFYATQSIISTVGEYSHMSCGYKFLFIKYLFVPYFVNYHIIKRLCCLESHNL